MMMARSAPQKVGAGRDREIVRETKIEADDIGIADVIVELHLGRGQDLQIGGGDVDLEAESEDAMVMMTAAGEGLMKTD